MNAKLLILAALIFSVNVSCKKEEEEKGKAIVAFDNATASLRLGKPKLRLTENDVTPSTPDILGLKIVAIYLVEDVDENGEDNVGMVARLWTNPVCDSDLTYCGVSDDAGEYQVTDYFDFARDSDEVNEELNAGKKELNVGTYRYIRADFAGKVTDDNDDVPNFRFGKIDADDTERIYEVRPSWGNGYSAKLAEPIKIADGDTVTVTIAYTYEDSFYDSTEIRNTPAEAADEDDSGNWFCGGEEIEDDSGGSNFGPCMQFSGFTPSAAKE